MYAIFRLATNGTHIDTIVMSGPVQWYIRTLPVIIWTTSFDRNLVTEFDRQGKRLQEWRDIQASDNAVDSEYAYVTLTSL